MNSRLKYYFYKAKTMPRKLVIRKSFREIENKGLDIIHKIFVTVFGTEITDAEFLKKAWSSKYKFESLEELQKYFRKRKEARLFVDLLKQGDAVSLIYQHFPDVPDRIIAQADKICDHIFDLLGSGSVKVYYGMKAKGFEGRCYNMQINSNKAHSSPLIAQKRTSSAIGYELIDWHIDFKSGYRWNPEIYYKDVKYGNKAGVDVKVPWELSRFQHLTTLGEAYFLSKNEKYVEEFINQITDWIENNPPKFGVNWVCTMDTSIRVCNWLLAWEFFKNSPLINDEFIVRFFKSLLQHGRCIKNNLEWSETLTSNHYLSNVVGLVYLGVLIPEFKESKKWKNFGMEELKKEMEKQVYPDGVDFEASTCYHRLGLELFFFATLLVVINDEDFKGDNWTEIAKEVFGEKYIQRLYGMFEFVFYALKPNGKMPQIGDNDNGRLHIFTNREVLDMRYLLALGAIFLKEPKFNIEEFGSSEEALWVFGEKGYKIWRDLKENCLANIGSRAFRDVGWYIMRNDKDYVFISCGPNGQNGNGGHCHNDKLSFELCINSKDIIVDPGTYVYTAEPEWRNKFRSTAYHNTIVVDAKEQNKFDEDNLFGMRGNAENKCLGWEISDEIDIFIGEHYGYERLSHPVVCQREVRFYKKHGGLEIIDRFKGRGGYDLEWNFILSPEVGGSLNINSDKLRWHKESTFYSDKYGEKIETTKVVGEAKINKGDYFKIRIKG